MLERTEERIGEEKIIKTMLMRMWCVASERDIERERG